MGVDFFREELDWAGARSDVLAWGYPRPVGELEAEVASWVRYGQGVLVWFLPGPEPESLAIHACAAPEVRGRLGTERHMTAIEVIGELLGATRLFVVTGEDGFDVRVPARALRRFLRSRGWVGYERGAYRNLGVVQ